MADSPFKIAKTIWRRIKVKFFILIDYLHALLEYWTGPHGIFSTHKKRLRPITQAMGEDRGFREKPEKIAIFVAYTTKVTHSNRAYLQALKEAGFAVMYINNARTDPDAITEISRLTWRAFDRTNIGRDFGGFKDGVLLLLQEGYLQTCKMLCIANDSMQFIPGRNAQALIESLSDFSRSNKVALFSHISQQVQTHYQSYFQVLKSEVFLSREFLSFWQRYVPLSHRGHCIYQGEIALSQKVYRRFFALHTLFTSDKLQEAIEQTFMEDDGVPAEALFRLMPSPARTVQRNKVGYSLNQLMLKSDLQMRLTGAHLYIIPDLIENGNPSHIAAFLYPFYLLCPFVKHDLCTGGTYTMAQAISLFKEALIASMGDEKIQEIQEFVDEFRDLMDARGVPMSYENRSREAAIKGVTGTFMYPSTYD